MLDQYFEISYDLNLNTPSFIDFSQKILSCSHTECVNFQKDINYFRNNFLLSAYQDHQNIEIEKKDLSEINKITKKLGKDSTIISCDTNFNTFITELFRNHSDMILRLNCNILFYKNNKPYSNFLHQFFKNFNTDIVHSKENLTHYLNLKKLYTPVINLESPQKTIEKIYSYDGETQFYQADKFTQENLRRLSSSDLLKFDYTHETIKEKYILLRSLIDVNKKENLPTNQINKIIDNLKNDGYIESFNYYYYNLICKYRKIEHFKYESFEDLDKAISFCIDLETSNKRGYLIEFREKYCVCYENQMSIEFKSSVETNKKRIIEEIKKHISDDFMLDSYSLKELVNIQIFNKIPVLETSDSLFEGKPLPLELVINKGMNMYNITDKLLNFHDKKYLSYDRSDFRLDKKISIDTIEKIDTYYSIIVNFEDFYITYDRDFYIPHSEDKFKDGVKKAIQKGYLISDFGIVRYTTTSELKIGDLYLPDWFQSQTEDEFSFLLNLTD